MRQRTSRILGATAAVVIAAIHLAPAAEAAVCRARMSGEGTGVGVAGQGAALARSNAMADWSRKVAARHGQRFASTALARSVRYDCRQGVLETKCAATAVPCAASPPKRPTRPKRPRR
jgi:hypothetical protein